MAGGEGMRLRPLTVNTPKPLVPLLGKPVMGYAVDLLKRHGMTRIGATLWYLPRKIREAFKRGEAWGVQMRYFEETAPLGTAGSVKLARDQLQDTFFVLSGDGLTDCDLTKALDFHRRKKALATLVLKRVGVPLPYGVVLTDQDQRITRFIEKPAWSRVYSDLVNTGIYILEPAVFSHIPDTGMPDFGKDIFPQLVAEGLPVYGFETDGYWCDVGNLNAYLEAQQALLRGEVSLPHAQGVAPDARIDPTARIEGSCLIGAGAVIGPGAVIRNAVIGEKCVIGPGALVDSSCLWRGAAVQEKARVCGSVLCDGAVARQGADLGAGCVLGGYSAAGPFSMLRPGVKVWPHAKVAPGAVVSAGIVSSAPQGCRWTSRGADCDTPENICSLCSAFVQLTGARQLMAAGEKSDAVLSLTAGALGAAGARVLSAGEMTETMLSTLVPTLRLDGGIFVSGQTLRFLDGAGVPVGPKTTSAMDGCVLRQEAPPSFINPGAVIRLTGAEDIYLSRIMPSHSARPLWSPVGVYCDSPFLLRLAQHALRRMDVRSARFGPAREREAQGDEVGFLLSETGDSVAVFTADGAIAAEQKTMLLLWLCCQQSGALYDVPGVPRLAASIASLQQADDSPACLHQRLVLRDGLAAMLAICDALRQGPLKSLLENLPEAHILSMDVACSTKDKGRILHSLCDHVTLPHTLGEGVRVKHETGYATIVPDNYRNLVRVTGEAASSELARELCDFYLDEIKKITQEKTENATMP